MRAAQEGPQRRGGFGMKVPLILAAYNMTCTCARIDTYVQHMILYSISMYHGNHYYCRFNLLEVAVPMYSKGILVACYSLFKFVPIMLAALDAAVCTLYVYVPGYV